MRCYSVPDALGGQAYDNKYFFNGSPEDVVLDLATAIDVGDICGFCGSPFLRDLEVGCRLLPRIWGGEVTGKTLKACESCIEEVCDVNWHVEWNHSRITFAIKQQLTPLKVSLRKS